MQFHIESFLNQIESKGFCNFLIENRIKSKPIRFDSPALAMLTSTMLKTFFFFSLEHSYVDDFLCIVFFSGGFDIAFSAFVSSL